MKNTFFIVFLIFSLRNFVSYAIFHQLYEVHVTNHLPYCSPSLFVHCASRDDEVVNGTLAHKGDVGWKFGMNFVRTTMFFCHFWWGSNNRSFEVFNRDYSDTCVYDEQTRHKKCIWIVRKDGFYLIVEGAPPNDKKKIYAWSL